MKPLKTFVLLAFLLAPSMAFAQYYRPAPAPGPGYYGGPAPSQTLPGGFHNRQGRLIFGGSLGLGGMTDRGGDIGCATCNHNPLTLGVAGHIGGFVGPRTALMLELQANAQTIASNNFDEDIVLVQSAAMIAGQYWVTPQLWLKGGVGLATLTVENTYWRDLEDRPQTGLSLLGAVGFELLSARNFSIDLQGRLIAGSYRGIDNQITSGTIGVGINWF